jgi:hypothetical protein
VSADAVQRIGDRISIVHLGEIDGLPAEFVDVRVLVAREGPGLPPHYVLDISRHLPENATGEVFGPALSTTWIDGLLLAAAELRAAERACAVGK